MSIDPADHGPHHGHMRGSCRVYLESGKTWVFAVALEWPGWCRRGRGEAAALQALVDYAPRYAAAIGPSFSAEPLQGVGHVSGARWTDFGAPGPAEPWDSELLSAVEATRFAQIVEACWGCLDRVRDSAPATLRKGPRGGGRDRDAIIEHVRESERSYARKLGLKLGPRTSWLEQRSALATAIGSGSSAGGWTARQAARRCAWHLLDHAWEIEDKSA